jgi:cytochrome c oxidase assembly factor CtaG
VNGPLVAGVLSFSVHAGAWVVILAITAAYAALIRRPRFAVSRAQAWSFLGAMGVLVVALTWPLANLAAHHLLLALVLQRLLLMLAAPPLLLRGLPQSLVALATRPPALDAAARTASRPIPAVVMVTVVAVGTLSVPAVDAQASSALARGGFDALLLLAGVVLWLPVLRSVPGTGRMSSLGRAAYLIVQSIVPSFLSIVWIFSRHPLYPAYATAGKVLGISPLLDQQLSGFTAKLGTICVLWTVAFIGVSRSERLGDDGGDEAPLTWADVERELERVQRRERRRTGPPQEGIPGMAGPGAGPLPPQSASTDPGGSAGTEPDPPGHGTTGHGKSRRNRRERGRDGTKGGDEPDR